jgi:hypothetical protein
MAKARAPAVAYLRTSSAANAGADKDSDKRQRAAIGSFAKRAGFEMCRPVASLWASGASP